MRSLVSLGTEEPTMLKVTTWEPDTHPGYIVEYEWEYDLETGRATARELCAKSVRYADGRCIHRDTHGADVVQEHYNRIVAEHITKNQALKIIADSLPAQFKKPVFDSDGDPVLDSAGKPRLVIKDKHRPRWEHRGDGRYALFAPGIDEPTYRELTAVLKAQFGDKVVLLKSGSKGFAS